MVSAYCVVDDWRDGMMLAQKERCPMDAYGWAFPWSMFEGVEEGVETGRSCNNISQ